MYTDESFVKRHRNNIKIAKELIDNNNYFGAAKIQRVLRCGYNEAINTLEQAIDDGVLSRHEKYQYKYKFNDS